MTYNIRKTNGVLINELDDEVIDTETISNIGLIGRLTPNYGETQSNNFVHLVENFADVSFPENAMDGQLCYKKISSDAVSHEGDLYLCVNEVEEDDTKKWKKLPIVYIGDEKPTNASVTGDMWYDKRDHAFKMYDNDLNDGSTESKNDGWLIIGPANYNDIKTIIGEDSSTTSSSSGENEISIYDFEDGLNKLEKKNKNIGYLMTIQVIGKECVAPITEGVTPVLNNGTYITGWKIQVLINCYKNSATKTIYEIVDEPDYELIGTNNRNWSVKLKLDGKNLKLKVKGSPRNVYENNILKWKYKIDMLKVS